MGFIAAKEIFETLPPINNRTRW